MHHKPMEVTPTTCSFQVGENTDELGLRCVRNMKTHESYVYVGRYMQGTWKVRNHDKYRQRENQNARHMQGTCKVHVYKKAKYV